MSTMAANEAARARKMVALQTFNNHTKQWETYGEYRAGGRPLKRAYNDIKPDYHHMDIQIVPVAEARKREQAASVTVKGETVNYPIPSDTQIRAIREQMGKLNAVGSTTQEKIAADGMLTLLKLAEFVRAETFIREHRA